jgi:pimeloyl-ACP methyl ester carboxylesterase
VPWGRVAARALAGLLLLVALPATIASGSTRRATLSPCGEAAAPDALCGAISVFEDRSSRRGRKIDLHVVVLPGIGGTSRPPLFFLEGGPGMAASDGVGMWAGPLKAYRERRDVVLLDQRGTGRSNPLRCEDNRRSAADFLAEMYPVDYVRRCRSQLEARADLAQYTTPAAADDLEDVRRELGYGPIDLFGLSYGTRLALVYMRMHPQSVRAAVLMGVTPTWARLPLHHSANAQRALRLLFQDCAGEAPCFAAYPDLSGDLAKVVETLGRSPARAHAVWPKGALATPVSITLDVFMEKLRRAMYAPATSRRVPAVIHAAARGDFAPFLEMALPSGDGSRRDADGLYLSVTCGEDTSRIKPADADLLTAGTAFGRYRVDQQTRACTMWPTSSVPPGWDRNVHSKAPVLLLSGGRDPVTPPEWAAAVARKLSRSLHVVVPLSAHLDEGLDDPECFDAVILSFLDRGTVEGLNTSCLARLKPRPFEVRR